MECSGKYIYEKVNIFDSLTELFFFNNNFLFRWIFLQKDPIFKLFTLKQFDSYLGFLIFNGIHEEPQVGFCFLNPFTYPFNGNNKIPVQYPNVRRRLRLFCRSC